MGDLIYFTSPQLSEQKELKHLFTSRLGGVSKGHLSSLNLGFSLGDNRENVIKNYEKICLALKVPLSSVVPSKQVHGDAVYVVCKEDAGVFPPDPERPGCDSLITQEKGITLAGFYADCSVALFYDAKQKAIGVAHSGWRGTALSIYKKTVLAMHANFNTNPRDILVSFAPSIGPCCFETDSDVPEALYYALTQKINPFIKKVGQKWRIDLVGINRMILQDAGILGEHIVDSGHCTGCEPEFFWSHRKTGGQRGVSAAFISMQ
ncbi:MAG: peptidoglycan editing factor PgeF [Clostridiales bacterium]|nr:peptidoglycan editing factor PgeF [Clostridiales bacterium]